MKGRLTLSASTARLWNAAAGCSSSAKKGVFTSRICSNGFFDAGQRQVGKLDAPPGVKASPAFHGNVDSARVEVMNGYGMREY